MGSLPIILMELTPSEVKIVEMLIELCDDDDPCYTLDQYGISYEDYEELKKKIQGDNYVSYEEDE